MGVVALAVSSQLGAASPSAGDSRRYNGGSVKMHPVLTFPLAFRGLAWFIVPMKRHHGISLGVCVLLAALIGCRSTYYAMWETFGKEKRDLLKSNVLAARDDQKKASEQFKSALDQLKQVYQFNGGDLEKAYNRFNSDYERCVSRADDVHSRISKVETIAGDLFKEWESEIKTMSNPQLRDGSRTKLNETRQKFDALHASMKRAEEGMAPILTQFHDQVLYIKHNLNAAAVGSLKGEAASIEKDIGKLITDMNASIAEADKFVKTLQ